MTSTTFAVGVGVGMGGMGGMGGDLGHHQHPHPTAASYSTSAQAQQGHAGTHHHSNNNSGGTNSLSINSSSTKSTNISTSASSNNNKSFSSNNSIFDAHRQNHNSSKLPAFRFADLKKDAIVLPTLLQHIPPSPVSPQPPDARAPDGAADGCPQLQQQQHPHEPSQSPQHGQQHQHQQQRDAHDQPGNQQIPGTLPDGFHNHTTSQNLPDKSPSPETPQLNSPFPHHASPPRTRASTFQPASAPTTNPDPSTGSKRPASFPDSPSVVGNAYASRTQSSSVVTPATKRRQTASAVTNGSEPNSTTIAADDANPTKEWAQGQRELLLPKTVDSAKSDERRKSRPPVSYRPPNAAGGRAVIPPIRSFRSSGSRKSLVLDMHVRRVSDESFGDDISETSQLDRTLRALEGRGEDDFSQITPPDSADAITDGDNTADLFMRIAREDSMGQVPEESERPGDQNAVSRLTRGTHRRPFSAAVPTYQATSPPRITRRLSDQRENARARQLADGQSAQRITRELSYRASAREKKPISSTTVTEDSGRSQPVRTPLRPSPITPRQISFQDASPEGGGSSAYRRRQSITESSSGASVSRASQYRNANLGFAQARTYNSSPLVPKSIDFQKHETQQTSEASHGVVEGTESSASTAAPSTVWDELDDLKSRIHRLELTGKVPSTSGAAMSRASDDRPPTATTNATTMSASPKRGSGAGAVQPDTSSTTSSQREPQPLLLSALSKTKNLVGPEVYSAMEAAAADALAMTLMIGTPGQPGPISSGASTIGGGGSLTDRQLRRKADSICRNLTELCIALADELGQTKPPQLVLTPREKEREPLASPTANKLAPTPSQRRPSALTDSTAPKPVMSPRAPTSLEQRRLSMLASTTLPSPRYAGAPPTPMEPSSAGRKTSLLLARTRRAGTEEPEEASGRRSSLLLRTRRAGTEEPEDNREGRKTSLLVRSRKATNEDDEESRFRAPSRAVTEVNSPRAAPRDFNSQNQTSPPDPNALGSSALPRRRLVPSSLNPRLVTPSTPSAAQNRRFLDRPAAERETNSVVEKLAEERGQRQFSLSQTAMLNRTGSINRRNRDSAIPSLPSQNAQAGGYR